ncbi:MAG: 16S rRNA (cytidine(1402)-2'-O)-methyltransferase [Candidatus Goldiibacteriota bacterium]
MSDDKSKLYIVATPIGNLKDMSFRAVETLKGCGLIIAEDTRKTKKLLAYYNIAVPAESYHKFNEKRKTDEIIERMKGGLDVALVSDAGMPAVSDPGGIIIRKCIEENISPVVIPGPSAAVCAFVLSGFEANGFVFLGFLPKKEGPLKKEIEKMADLDYPVIIYESPKRVRKTLSAVSVLLDDPQVSVSKEITKIYEKTLRGSAGRVIEMLTDDMLKGEFTIVIEPGENHAEKKDREKEAGLYFDSLIKKGFKKSAAVKETAEKFGINKNALYRNTHKV